MASGPHSRAAPTSVRLKAVSADRPNTIGFGPRELALLLDFLDNQEAAGRTVRREFARWPFRQASLCVTLTHPGGSVTSLKLAGRNISRGGVSMLHNGFMHTGSECVVSLPRANGSVVEKPGKITRCLHRRGTLHEIGVKFASPIRLREFVGGPNSADIFSLENVEPVRLRGRILYIEDSALDAKIVSHFLRETSLRLDIVGSAKEAEAKLNEDYDLLMIDWRLPDAKGTDVLRRARDAGVGTHALIVSADPVGVMAENIWEVPDSGVLTKPFTQEQLLQQIGEVLLAEGSSPASAKPPGGAGTTVFAVSQVRQVVAALEQAMADNDRARTMDTCYQLRGCAPMLGMNQVAKTAERACAALAKTTSLEEVPRAVRELVTACKRELEHQS